MKTPFLCSLGFHEFRPVSWPVGYGKLPSCVGECARCGVVRDVEASLGGGVEIGRWSSLEEMRRSVAAEKAAAIRSHKPSTL